MRQNLRERNAAAKGPQHPHPHPPPENLQLVNVSTVTGNIFNPVHCTLKQFWEKKLSEKKFMPLNFKISGQQVL